MKNQIRANIVPGLRVAIVLKKDQKTGILTEGLVQDILTSSAQHHRGIKVRLTDGQVGRIQKILEQGEIAPNHVSQLSSQPVSNPVQKEKETVIFLIRHSEVLTQVENKTVEQEEQQINEKIILSVEGEKKALELSKHDELKQLNAVYSSHYVRAMATAKYIALQNQLPIQVEQELGERKLGDLRSLHTLGEQKKNPFTIEQLLDLELNNEQGESALQVRQRMYHCIERLLMEQKGNRIAIVSHGAAMKFLFTAWCDYRMEDNTFIFQKNKIISATFSSPCMFQLTFKGTELISLQEIK